MYAETFKSRGAFQNLQVLQEQMQVVFPYIQSLLQDTDGVTVYYYGPVVLTDDIKYLLQQVINNFVDVKAQQNNVIFSGSLKVLQSSALTSAVMTDTSDSTSLESGALIVRGGVAVRKTFVAGGGINASMKNIRNVANPINTYDAVNKAYVDDIVASAYQKAPIIFKNDLPMSTTSRIWTPYLTALFDKVGTYKMKFACTYSADRFVSLRLRMGTDTLSEIHVRTSPEEQRVWSEALFDFTVSDLSVPVVLEMKSDYGKSSTLVNALLEITPEQTYSPVIIKKFSGDVTTTSVKEVPVFEHTTPTLSAGIYRFVLSFSYQAQKRIHAFAFIDGDTVVNLSQYMTSDEMHRHLTFHNTVWALETTHVISLFVTGDTGYWARIWNCTLSIQQLQ